MNVIECYFLVILTFKAIVINGKSCHTIINQELKANFCSGSGKSAEVGDFNGDGKDDFVCHDSNTGDNVIYYAPFKPFESLKSVMRDKWCSGLNSRFFVSDFNGDGRSDFLCHTVNNGDKWIAYADKDGKFTGTGWHKAMEWCHAASDEVHVGDFNGDNRTDMLCHHTLNGYKWIAFANEKGEFDTTTWSSAFPKCNGKLYTGDFNGDRKTDILCHQNGTFEKLISLAGPSNNVFSRIDWTGQSWWCGHTGSFLRIGDINGDGLDDLICKDDMFRGNLWYSLNVGKPNFVQTSYTVFCPWSKPQNFYLADVTGDGKKEFLCINDSGHVQVGVSGCF